MVGNPELGLLAAPIINGAVDMGYNQDFRKPLIPRQPETIQGKMNEPTKQQIYNQSVQNSVCYSINSTNSNTL